MIIIGEKINGSIPAVAQAIASRDSEFIKNRARMQDEAGATFIDCCASVPEAEEVETLKWMIDCIQEVSDLPIAVDSPSANVLAQVFPYCKRPGLINSVSGEGNKVDTIFPLIADTKWITSWPRRRNTTSAPAVYILIPLWKCCAPLRTESP